MTEPLPAFDPAAVLDRISAATEDVIETASRFDDADVSAPSLLPDWSRGHVLNHLARNADGGRRLLIWARTGVETHEYPSMAARAEEIEAGGGRSADELVADLRDSAALFAAEYRRMPLEAWNRPVRWTGGQQHPALRAADSRLAEVLVHHVDLGAGYTSAHWPTDFVQDMLSRVVAALDKREGVPGMWLHATDTGARYDIHPATASAMVPAPALDVSGTEGSLLAWLMGRSHGADLAVPGGAELPKPPALY